jgi:beta-glucosidase
VTVDRPRITDLETAEVRVRVRNTGERAGQEVVQLYVRDDAATVVRPRKELRGFEKISLAPGEEKEVRFTLGKRAFAFWDDRLHDWRVEPGEFTVLVGASSRDLRGEVKLTVTPARPAPRRYDENTLLADVLAHPVLGRLAAALEGAFMKRMGDYPPGSAEAVMMEATIREMPLRNVVRMGRALTEAQLGLLLDVLNGKRAPAVLEELARR